MLKVDFRRNRAPMGGRLGLAAEPASWRAGHRYDVSVLWRSWAAAMAVFTALSTVEFNMLCSMPTPAMMPSTSALPAGFESFLAAASDPALADSEPACATSGVLDVIHRPRSGPARRPPPWHRQCGAGAGSASTLRWRATLCR